MRRPAIAWSGRSPSSLLLTWLFFLVSRTATDFLGDWPPLLRIPSPPKKTVPRVVGGGLSPFLEAPRPTPGKGASNRLPERSEGPLWSMSRPGRSGATGSDLAGGVTGLVPGGLLARGREQSPELAVTKGRARPLWPGPRLR